MGDLTPEERTRLLAAAQDASAYAYEPHSGFAVGAALITEDGVLFRGCNVENDSYSLTICAERVALFTAVAARGLADLRGKALAVVARDGKPSAPCGACRQVMFQLIPNAMVLFTGTAGAQEMTVEKLLPAAFRLDGEPM